MKIAELRPIAVREEYRVHHRIEHAYEIFDLYVEMEPMIVTLRHWQQDFIGSYYVTSADGVEKQSLMVYEGDRCRII
jgi:hypothetical protein